MFAPTFIPPIITTFGLHTPNISSEALLSYIGMPSIEKKNQCIEKYVVL